MRNFMRSFPSLALSVCALAAAAALTACTSSSPVESTAAGDAAPAGSGGTVATRQVSGLGTVLTTGSGQVLYLNEPDNAQNVTCTTSQCLANWPPVAANAGTPTAGAGVNAALLGSIEGPSGPQITYANWPLYTFVGDIAPSQATGHNLTADGGVWFAITPQGAKAG
jgi:predicted lipoprotein with Yx(FWY)xxD motif